MPAENRYEPHAIESRWQRLWEQRGTFHASNPSDADFDPGRPKYYVLDMFPYPSGSGLHVGHALGYVATDAIARRKRMQGYNVLHPMGWDSFGLPAEQYAIQTGKHPAETTALNTANYRAQLKRIGMAYDWSREIDTSSPSYYRWTQRLFGVLFEAGLAYQAEVPVWWCEELKTVLANEEVINGRSERGNHPCERRPLKQWMLKITAFADRLLADLEEIDWPESIEIQQREWIGRSEGAEVDFAVEGLEDEALSVFTTRPDTLFGATFMVVAPEHPLLERLVADEQRAAVEDYARAAAAKSDLERTDLARDKSGVFTGTFAVNPLMDAGEECARLPIWVADYVLMGYGTGAIMAVPGHDERDFEFATRFDLPVIEVVQPPVGTPGAGDGACFSGEGTAVNSGLLDGLPTPAAIARAVELLEDGGTGRARVTYRLRDWLFSRQRYWGEPFPLLHLEDGSITLLPEEDLPLELPVMEDFAPSAEGSAPLARDPDWARTIDPRTGRPARRDTDTMPGWAGSCWYWLRFMDPHNDEQPFSAEAESYWGPVDLYVGGAAHAVMHLLYARFWHKVLHDAGLVSTAEPFQALFNQGMIQAFAYQDATERLVPTDEVEARGGRFFRVGSDEELTQIVTKMAKSLGNVVNPDDIIAEYGADTFRLYEMFMGPLADSKPWNPRDIPGCRRFLDRAWRMLVDPDDPAPVRPRLLEETDAALEGDALFLEREVNRALSRVDDSYERFNLNTGIAALMSFVNEAGKRGGALTRSQAERFLSALAPLAPHFCEELWNRLGHTGPIAHAPWPEVAEASLEEETYELVVQVNGKLRGRTQVSQAAEPAALEAQAAEIVAAQLEGKRLLKAVVVPGKLVNFVVR
ncbi:MAG: leucine--tRNA ligase [Planctomycetes bacterium]|nr:leucine--tRNA ligase [Planctomycetota bacterium]